MQRNHSILYFSFPGYDFENLRKEAPGQYEAYADMVLNEWITLKIEFVGAKAKLYLNNNKQPSQLVNVVKQVSDLSGVILLWVDIVTEGYFYELKV